MTGLCVFSFQTHVCLQLQEHMHDVASLYISSAVADNKSFHPRFCFRKCKTAERGKFINHHAILLSFFKSRLLSRNNNKKISARIIRRRLHMSPYMRVCVRAKRKESERERERLRFIHTTLNYLRRI